MLEISLKNKEYEIPVKLYKDGKSDSVYLLLLCKKRGKRVFQGPGIDYAIENCIDDLIAKDDQKTLDLISDQLFYLSLAKFPEDE